MTSLLIIFLFSFCEIICKWIQLKLFAFQLIHHNRLTVNAVSFSFSFTHIYILCKRCEVPHSIIIIFFFLLFFSHYYDQCYSSHLYTTEYNIALRLVYIYRTEWKSNKQANDFDRWSCYFAIFFIQLMIQHYYCDYMPLSSFIDIHNASILSTYFAAYIYVCRMCK